MSRLLLLTLLSMIGLATATRAAPIDAPVPENAFIRFQGLDWAWGGACPYTNGCGDGDLSFQSSLGWRLPTSQELLRLPTNFATMFRFPGANAPDLGTEAETGAYFSGVPGGDAACASAWFSTVHSHCDWNDGAQAGWAGLIDSEYAEQLYVRGLFSAPATAVPEPFGLGMLGLALATLVVARRSWTHRGAGQA